MSLLPAIGMRTTFAVLLLVGCCVRSGDAQEATMKPQKTARKAKRWGDPIPVGEDAVTARDAAKYVFDYNLRTLVDAYKEVGSRKDAWDDAAIEWLTEVARHFAAAKGYKSPEGYKSQEELIVLAEPLVENDCDDPMVQYCLGAMLQDADQNKVAKERGTSLVEGSYVRLVERGYPANRRYSAASRIWRNYKWQKREAEETEKYFALMQKHALEMVLQDDLEGNDGRSLYDSLSTFFMYLPAEGKAEFCEAANEHAKASPFVVNMLIGQYRLDAAWEERGSGRASEVEAGGWKGFRTNMQLARESFEKAWEVAPHRPEAAAAMVRVAMASSRSPHREMRQWFDRAVKAQCDYRAAYTSLMFGLKPRWHGTHDQIYRFGVECMNTARYDTDTPFMLLNTLWSITGDVWHDSQRNLLLRKSESYKNVRTVCQRYLEQEIRSGSDEWWKTAWLGFAYYAEEWEDAARLLDELNSDLNADALSRFPLAAEEVISAIKINTSPHADAVAKAFDAADSGQREPAIVAMKELLSASDLQPSVANRVRSRLQGLNWSSEFEKGEPVSLLPEANLDGWKTVSGSWTQTDDGTIRGVSDKAGVILESEANFGTYWQISGELTHGKSPHNPWFAGILLLKDERPQYSIMFHPFEKWVAAGPHDRLKKHQQPFKPAGKTTKFVICVEGDIVSVWLNDELLIQEQEVRGLADFEDGNLAIGAKYWWPDSTLIYKNLKIEKLVPEA